jgi:hypothetical protein
MRSHPSVSDRFLDLSHQIDALLRSEKTHKLGTLLTQGFDQWLRRAAKGNEHGVRHTEDLVKAFYLSQELL